MLKTTYKDAKRFSNINGREDFIKFLRDNGLKVKSAEKVAYYWGTYGLNGYLIRYTLDNDIVIDVITGLRTSWQYSCQNSDFGLPLDVVVTK